MSRSSSDLVTLMEFNGPGNVAARRLQFTDMDATDQRILGRILWRWSGDIDSGMSLGATVVEIIRLR